MNYCSLEDAWGCNNPSNQIKEYMANTNNEEVPTSQPTSQPTRQPTSQPTRQPTSQPTSQPTGQPTSQPTGQPTRQPTSQPTGQPIIYKPSIHDETQYDCEKVMQHIQHCKSCYNKCRTHFRPHLIENVNNILNDNKDVIVLILIGISILLFFNLINNLTK